MVDALVTGCCRHRCCGHAKKSVKKFSTGAARFRVRLGHTIVCIHTPPKASPSLIFLCFMHRRSGGNRLPLSVALCSTFCQPLLGFGTQEYYQMVNTPSKQRL